MISPLVAGTIIIPLCLLVLTILARNLRETPLTSGADLVSLLLGFDFGVLLATDDFQRLAANQELADSLGTMHIVLLAIGFTWWFVAVSFVEPRLAKSYDSRTGYRGGNSPFFFAVFSWLFGYVLAGAHVLAFIGKPT